MKIAYKPKLKHKKFNTMTNFGKTIVSINLHTYVESLINLLKWSYARNGFILRNLSFPRGTGTTGLTMTSKSGFVSKIKLCRAHFRVRSSSKIRTRWIVALIRPADQNSRSCPTFSRTVSLMGVASIQLPSSRLTSSPPTMSWNSAVSVPQSACSPHRIAFGGMEESVGSIGA